MLPSMPLLFSSSRDSMIDEGMNQIIPGTPQGDNESVQKESKEQIKMCLSNDIPNMAFEIIPEDGKECDDELVLLAENSPFGEKRKLHAQTTAAVRKKKKIDVPEPLLEDRNSNDEQANHFAMAYFMKAKGELDEQTFQKFIALLSELDDSNVNAVALFHEISQLLSGYPDLAEEFVGFLQPHQAMEANKLDEFLTFEQSWNFFRKLDAFHLNKVNHLLEQHATNPEITSEAVRSSLLSTFKGHPNIAEGFLSLLPNGKPLPRCKEDYEDISELGLGDSSTWERLSIIDSTSRGCVPGDCDCLCHTFPVKKFCTFCNVKFSNGQIYVQTGKGLRFAKVTFRGCQQEDVIWRLNPTFYNKPTSRKRTKSSSQQNKESSGGGEQSGKRDVTSGEVSRESDKTDTSPEKYSSVLERVDEDDEILFLESQLNNDLNSDEPFIVSEDVVLESTNSDEAEDFEFDGIDEFANDGSPISIKQDEDSHNSEQASDTNDDINTTEIDLENNSKENALEDQNIPKIKSEPTETLELEQNTFEEQICLNTDNPPMEVDIKEECMEDTTENKPSTSSEDIKMWTREEDKLILQAFQHQLSSEQTFSKISNLMPSRTVDDIQGRFQVLMSLLEKMTNGCYDNNSPP